METEVKQLWNSKGESCPQGTIPIRRQTESEIFTSDSISTFGKTTSRNDFSPSDNGHEVQRFYLIFVESKEYNIRKESLKPITFM